MRQETYDTLEREKMGIFWNFSSDMMRSIKIRGESVLLNYQRTISFRCLFQSEFFSLGSDLNPLGNYSNRLIKQLFNFRNNSMPSSTCELNVVKINLYVSVPYYNVDKY